MSEAAFARWALTPGPQSAPVMGDGATLREVQVPEGHVASRHSHTHEQFLLVTAGSGTLQCAAGEVALAPGTVIHLPAGAWHSAQFTSATVLVEVNLVEAAAKNA
jgi:quercetin dioxygenase-like cupin family protein